jgi:hypothetical protein
MDIAPNEQDSSLVNEGRFDIDKEHYRQVRKQKEKNNHLSLERLHSRSRSKKEQNYQNGTIFKNYHIKPSFVKYK